MLYQPNIEQSTQQFSVGMDHQPSARGLFTPTTLPLLLLVAGLAVLYSLRRRSSGGRRLPPTPPGLPILGHLHLLAPLPHRALHRLAGRHGPLLHLRLGSVPCVVACSPDAAREVLKTHEAAFLDRPNTTPIERLSYGGQGFIFSPYGPYWRFMKRACVHELLAGQTLDRLRHVRREEVARLLGSLRRTSADEGAHVDVDAALMALAGDIVSRMVMSRRWTGDDTDIQEMRRLVAEIAELSGTFSLQDYIGAFRYWDVQGLGKRIDAVNSKVDAMMERILTAREAVRRLRRQQKAAADGEEEEKDVLDMLFDMHEDEAAEMRLTRGNIKAFMLEMFEAGTDTAAITLDWALSELINNPDVLRKLQAELDSVVGNGRLADELDIPNLPYLQAVARETMRLHPAAPMVTRRSREPCTVDGYDVPAGATVFVNVWAIGRDPACWPEPLEFRPERFMDGGANAGTDVRGQHFHLLPFGSGRRTCPGASLALLVVQAALAAMVQCFEWSPVGGAPVDMEEGPGMTTPRKRPLVCTVSPRLHPLPPLQP